MIKGSYNNNEEDMRCKKSAVSIYEDTPVPQTVKDFIVARMYECAKENDKSEILEVARSHNPNHTKTNLFKLAYFKNTSGVRYNKNDPNKQVPLSKDGVISDYVLHRYQRLHKKYVKAVQPQLNYDLVRTITRQDVEDHFVINMLRLIDLQFFSRRLTKQQRDIRFHNMFVLNFISDKNTKGTYKSKKPPFIELYEELSTELLHKKTYTNVAIQEAQFWSRVSSRSVRDLLQYADGQMQSGEDNSNNQGNVGWIGSLFGGRKAHTPPSIKEQTIPAVLTGGNTINEIAEELTSVVKERLAEELELNRDEMLSFSSKFFGDMIQKSIDNFGEEVKNAFASVGEFFVNMFERIKEWFMQSFSPAWNDFWEGKYEWQVQFVLAFSLLGKKISDFGCKTVSFLFGHATHAIFDCDLDLTDLPWGDLWNFGEDGNFLNPQGAHTWEETERRLKDDHLARLYTFVETSEGESVSEADSQNGLEFEAEDSRALAKIVSSIGAICVSAVKPDYARHIQSVAALCPDFLTLAQKCFNLIMYACTHDPAYLGEKAQLEEALQLIVEAQRLTSDLDSEDKVKADLDYINAIRDLHTKMQTFEVTSLVKMTNPKLRGTCILFNKYASDITKLHNMCMNMDQFKQQRRTPGYLFFTGPAGHGKSTVILLLQRLIYQMERRMGNPKCKSPFTSLSVYTPTMGDDFKEGWFGQSIYNRPEDFSTKDEQMNLQSLRELLLHISGENAPMPKAFGSKGKSFMTADWIMTSTNCPLTAFTNKGLEDVSAFYRRILLPLGVRRVRNCNDPNYLIQKDKVNGFWVFCIPRSPHRHFRSLNEAIERAQKNGVELSNVNPANGQRSTDTWFLNLQNIVQFCYLYVRHQISSESLENKIFGFNDKDIDAFLDDMLGENFEDLDKWKYVDIRKKFVSRKPIEQIDEAMKDINATLEGRPTKKQMWERDVRAKKDLFARLGRDYDEPQSISLKDKHPDMDVADSQCRVCRQKGIDDIDKCEKLIELNSAIRNYSDVELADAYWLAYWKAIARSVEAGEMPDSQYSAWMAVACRWKGMEVTQREIFKQSDIGKIFFPRVYAEYGRLIFPKLSLEDQAEAGQWLAGLYDSHYGPLFKIIFNRFDLDGYEDVVKDIREFELYHYNVTWVGTGNGFTEFFDGFYPYLWAHGYSLTSKEIFILIIAVVSLILLITGIAFLIKYIVNYFSPSPEDTDGSLAAEVKEDYFTMDKDEFITKYSKDIYLQQGAMYDNSEDYWAAWYELTPDQFIAKYGYDKHNQCSKWVAEQYSSGQSYDAVKAKINKRKNQRRNNKVEAAQKRVRKAHVRRTATGQGGTPAVHEGISARELFAQGQGLLTEGINSAVMMGSNMRYLNLYCGSIHMGGAHIMALGDGIYSTANHVMNAVSWDRFTITSFYDPDSPTGQKFYARDDVDIKHLGTTRDGCVIKFKNYTGMQMGVKHLKKYMFHNEQQLKANLPYLKCFRVLLSKNKQGRYFFLDSLHQAKFIDTELKCFVESPYGDTFNSKGNRAFINVNKGYLRISQGGGRAGDCGDIWMGQHEKTGQVFLLGGHFAKDKANNACCYPLYKTDVPEPEACSQSALAPHLEGLMKPTENVAFVRGYDQVGETKFYPAEGGTDYKHSALLKHCLDTKTPFPWEIESTPAIRRKRTTPDGQVISPFNKTNKGLNNSSRPEFPEYARRALQDYQYHVFYEGFFDGCEAPICRFLTIEEVIFGCKWFDGLNTSAAVGAFKWAFPGLNKRSLLWDKEKRWIHPELRKAVMNVVKLARSGVVPLFIVFRALKDELLAWEKVKAYKCRAFSACDVVQNIVLAMVYGMPSYYFKRSMDSPASGKFNPHSCDAELFARKFPGGRGKMGLDGSFWDGSVNPGWAFIMANSYNEKFYGFRKDSSDYNLLCCITKSVCDSLFVRGNKLYSPTSGHISGSQITTDINNFINYCQYQMIWRYLYPGVPFRSVVVIIVGGDDVRLENTDPDTYPLFNMAICAQYMKDWFGVVCTNPDKTPITQEFFNEDPDFLSREIKVVDGLTVAQLKKESIVGMLAYVREDVEDAEQMNIDAASMEMVMYGPEEYGLFYEKLNGINRQMGMPYRVYNYSYWKNKLNHKYWKIDEPSPLDAIYGVSEDIKLGVAEAQCHLCEEAAENITEYSFCVVFRHMPQNHRNILHDLLGWPRAVLPYEEYPSTSQVDIFNPFKNAVALKVYEAAWFTFWAVDEV